MAFITNDISAMRVLRMLKKKITLAIENWKTYQLSKQLAYVPKGVGGGAVFCEFFSGSVPVTPKYPYSMQHYEQGTLVLHIADKFSESDNSF